MFFKVVASLLAARRRSSSMDELCRMVVSLTPLHHLVLFLLSLPLSLMYAAVYRETSV